MPGNKIPTAPGGPGTPTNPPPPAPSGSGSGSGGSGTGGGAKDPYAAAQARADAKEREAKRKAAQRNLADARTLNAQIKALQAALGSGFREALNTKLANIRLVSRDQDRALREAYQERVKDLADTQAQNEKASSDQSYANLSNRGRERLSAMSEAALQGAGESDLLRSQLMSLRNWDANQGEVNRAFADTMQSINSSLGDLTTDTRTSRMNIATQANADRASLWNDYYAQRSEAYTQLGNLYGQQSELYGLANEAVSSRRTRRKRRRTDNLSGDAFMDAADAVSQSYKDPGVPDRLKQWEGADPFAGREGSSVYQPSTTIDAPKRPEGASLRTWE